MTVASSNNVIDYDACPPNLKPSQSVPFAESGIIEEYGDVGYDRADAGIPDVKNQRKYMSVFQPEITNAREVLIELYEKTLNLLTEYDETRFYNQNVKRLCETRLKICQESKSVEELEKKIAAGNDLSLPGSYAENLIRFAEDEYELVAFYNDELKPWEADPLGDAEFEQWGGDLWDKEDEPTFPEAPEVVLPEHLQPLPEQLWDPENPNKHAWGVPS